MSVAVHHRVDGAAELPVLVLANPLGTSLACWDPVVERLRGAYRIVRYDHRGQGASPVPEAAYSIASLGGDVLALLDGLDVGTVDFAGVSLGGMVGLWLAAHAPERIRRLTVLCSSAHPGSPEAWRARAAQVRRAGGTGPVAEAIVSRWLTPAFAQRHAETRAGLQAMLVDSPATGYAGLCEMLASLDLRAEIPRIRTPTLIVAGAQDGALPPPHSARIIAGIPGARGELLDPAAHLPMAERPHAVASLIRRPLEASEMSDHLTQPDPYDAGMRVRRAVLGAAHVDRAVAGTTAFTAPFQDLITRYAWGSVWTREGLDLPTRSAITLAVLCALGHEEELAMHVRSALRNGLSAEQISEVLLHTAVYAGVPAANRAYRIAQGVLAEDGVS